MQDFGVSNALNLFLNENLGVIEPISGEKKSGNLSGHGDEWESRLTIKETHGEDPNKSTKVQVCCYVADVEDRGLASGFELNLYQDGAKEDWQIHSLLQASVDEVETSLSEKYADFALNDDEKAKIREFIQQCHPLFMKVHRR